MNTTTTNDAPTTAPPSIDDLERELATIDLDDAEVQNYEGRLSDADLAALRGRSDALESKIRVGRQRLAEERAKALVANAAANGQRRDELAAKLSPDGFAKEMTELVARVQPHAQAIAALVKELHEIEKAKRAESFELRSLGGDPSFGQRTFVVDSMVRRIGRLVSEELKAAGLDINDRARVVELLGAQ